MQTPGTEYRQPGYNRDLPGHEDPDEGLEIASKSDLLAEAYNRLDEVADRISEDDQTIITELLELADTNSHENPKAWDAVLSELLKTMSQIESVPQNHASEADDDEEDDEGSDSGSGQNTKFKTLLTRAENIESIN